MAKLLWQAFIYFTMPAIKVCLFKDGGQDIFEDAFNEISCITTIINKIYMIYFKYIESMFLKKCYLGYL